MTKMGDNEDADPYHYEIHSSIRTFGKIERSNSHLAERPFSQNVGALMCHFSQHIFYFRAAVNLFSEMMMFIFQTEFMYV